MPDQQEGQLSLSRLRASLDGWTLDFIHLCAERLGQETGQAEGQASDPSVDAIRSFLQRLVRAGSRGMRGIRVRARMEQISPDDPFVANCEKHISSLRGPERAVLLSVFQVGDERVARLVAQRCSLVEQVALCKLRSSDPVLDPAREDTVVHRAAEESSRSGLPEELAGLIFRSVLFPLAHYVEHMVMVGKGELRTKHE